MNRNAELAIDDFNKLLRHYLILALERSGVNLDRDCYAELDSMADSLKHALKAIVEDPDA